MTSRPARDHCVVETGPLSELLTGFERRWNRDRPPDPAGRDDGRQKRPRGRGAPISAVPWLAAETRLPRRTILNVMRAEYPTTELRIADALVAAIGRQDALADGTLVVKPNPSVPRSSCCGGSELTRLAHEAVRQGCDIEDLIGRGLTGALSPPAASPPPPPSQQ